MLDILPSPDHVAAFRIGGTLDADDYRRIVAHLEATLARHETIGVLADMTGFADMTAEAAGMDLRYNLRKLGEWGRFRRAAVLTDRQWMRALVGLFNALIPHVEMRAFDSGRGAEALAWVADLP